jgi:Outer membrane protein beta-barrel family
VNGVYNLNSEISYSMPVHFLKGTVEISGNLGYNKGIQFINAVQNNTRTFSTGPNLRLDMSPTQKLNIGLSSGIDYNKTNYSSKQEYNTDYLSQEYGATIDWELPKGFYFSSDFIYTINSQRAEGFNTKVPLWNASISKQMLKFNRGELKIRAFDLLNRNIGVTRNTNGNYIEDNRVKTLRQFFLLSFTYSLTKMGLNNGGSGHMRIIAR